MRALALALTLAALPVQAQQPPVGSICEPSAVMQKHLEDKYGETLVAFGLTPGGSSMLQFFASENGATWTAVMATAKGLSCVVAAGFHWGVVPPVVGDPT